jgi:hypothetical protein
MVFLQQITKAVLERAQQGDRRRYAPMVFGIIPKCRSDSSRISEIHWPRILIVSK